MKKILIAIDYGPTAQKVAEAGYTLAKKLNAETLLLHVVLDVMYYSSPEYSPVMGYTGMTVPPVAPELTEERLKQEAEKFLAKTKEHLGGNNISTVVAHGACADAILETAASHEVDTIVMGSHSHKWLEKILLGSTVEKVLNNTTKPLFIIPTKENKH